MRREQRSWFHYLAAAEVAPLFVEADVGQQKTQEKNHPRRLTIAIELSRDTLLLLSAVGFLLFAITLTYLFPVPEQEGGKHALQGSEQTFAQGQIKALSDKPEVSIQSFSPDPAATLGQSITSTIQVDTTATGMAVASMATVSPSATSVQQHTQTVTPASDSDAPTGVTATHSTPDASASATSGEADLDAPRSTPGQPANTGRVIANPVPAAPVQVIPTQPPQRVVPTTAGNNIPEYDLDTPNSSTRNSTGEQPASATYAAADGPPTDIPLLETDVTPTVTPSPAPPPLEDLSGDWRLPEVPQVTIDTDRRIPAGTILSIGPGVQVVLKHGVSIIVEGALDAEGAHFVSEGGGLQWEGIFGQTDSTIKLVNVELRNGGSGGTLISSIEGTLDLNGVRINDTGGHIEVIDGRAVNIQNSIIENNTMPFGAIIDILYRQEIALGETRNVTVVQNRITSNRLSPGAAAVRIGYQGAEQSPPLFIHVQNNVFNSDSGGANLELMANGPVFGDVNCNIFTGGSQGISVQSELPENTSILAQALRFTDNLFQGHLPTFETIASPVGRGATSQVPVDMNRNYWGHGSGPYMPALNPEGQGEAVGINITFYDWLTDPPACAVTP